MKRNDFQSEGMEPPSKRQKHEDSKNLEDSEMISDLSGDNKVGAGN